MWWISRVLEFAALRYGSYCHISWGPVYTYTGIFENTAFIMWLGLSSTCGLLSLTLVHTVISMVTLLVYMRGCFVEDNEWKANFWPIGLTSVKDYIYMWNKEIQQNESHGCPLYHLPAARQHQNTNYRAHRILMFNFYEAHRTDCRWKWVNAKLNPQITRTERGNFDWLWLCCVCC